MAIKVTEKPHESKSSNVWHTLPEIIHGSGKPPVCEGKWSSVTFPFHDHFHRFMDHIFGMEPQVYLCQMSHSPVAARCWHAGILRMTSSAMFGPPPKTHRGHEWHLFVKEVYLENMYNVEYLCAMIHLVPVWCQNHTAPYTYCSCAGLVGLYWLRCSVKRFTGRPLTTRKLGPCRNCGRFQSWCSRVLID